MGAECPQERPNQEEPRARLGISLHNKLALVGQDYLTSDRDPLVVYGELADYLNGKCKEIPYSMPCEEATDLQTEKPEPSLSAISAVGIAPFHYYEPAARHQAPSDTPLVKPEVFERARILREPVIAAIARVITGGIAQRLMRCSNSSSLDVERLLGKMADPFRYYSYRMKDFLEDSVLDILMELSSPRHPYNRLLQLAFRVERDYISMIDGPNPKYGTQKKTPSSPPELISRMFWNNYLTDIANFLAAHGIAMQHEYGELPDSSTMLAATAEARPHWLALAALSRKAFGRLIQGKERFARVLRESAATGRLPTWSHFWYEGLDRASLSDYGNNPPYHTFAGCQFQSALLRRKAGEPISERVGSPRRCAGQLGLWLPDDPATSEFYELMNGSLPGENRISVAEFTLDLGRAAVGPAYAGERFRDAIRRANQAINEVAPERA